MTPAPATLRTDPRTSRAVARDGGGHAAIVAATVYVVWVAATYLLEGAQQTLLRPEAQLDRLVYTVVANLGAGLVLPLWTLRVLSSPRASVPLLSPCGSAPCTSISVAAAAVIGLMRLAPTWSDLGDAALHLNVFAQVLPTSIAEVIVCWVLAGAVACQADSEESHQMDSWLHCPRR